MFRAHRALDNPLQPGIDASRTRRRFLDKAAELAFRQVLIASLRFHFEWDRILFSEKHKPKPPPEPPVAKPPPPWARLIALRPLPEPQPVDTVTVEGGAAEEPMAARTTKEIRK
jgi:hypothetical protein